jgi:hypothetical protein
MALTPISGPAPYCTPTQLLRRYDFRSVGQYLADDGVKMTQDEVLASPILADLLREASGHLESALLRSGRYTPADLGALTNNGLEMVAGLVAGYTMFLVWARRPSRFLNDQLPLQAQLAMDKLQELATGHRVLPFQEAADAGRIHHDVEQPPVVFRRRLAAVIARPLFGLRGNEYTQDQSTSTPTGM